MGRCVGSRDQRGRVWGLPVAISPQIAVGTALVGCFKSQAQLFRRGGLRVESTNSHSDFFQMNLIARYGRNCARRWRCIDRWRSGSCRASRRSRSRGEGSGSGRLPGRVGCFERSARCSSGQTEFLFEVAAGVLWRVLTAGQPNDLERPRIEWGQPRQLQAVSCCFVR